jgi:5-formyltetrahydrofolate cyclo-ligase
MAFTDLFDQRWETDGSVVCPKCERKHAHREVHRSFERADYRSEFTMECANPECEHEMTIAMEPEPHFALVLEEREARRKRVSR